MHHTRTQPHADVGVLAIAGGWSSPRKSTFFQLLPLCHYAILYNCVGNCTNINEQLEVSPVSQRWALAELGDGEADEGQTGSS